MIAKRTTDPPVETAEIRALAEAAGHDVRAAVTQVRGEDAGTYLGRGKVEELAETVAAADARLVVVDGELTPTQSVTLCESLPDGTDVFDRYRLVLSIFAAQAQSRRAQLQIELARLRYALPRLRERSDVQGLNKLVEKGTPVDGVENRIADLERKLAALPSPAEQYRERRREQGFDLVTVAGYTNAGKSTLLHRLADDMELADAERSADGPGTDAPSADPTAAVADRLFETLETTTRRATIADRPTLVTDTVGFVDDLPHWLVESFSETLSEAAAADAVVLVVDASDDPDEMARKLRVSLDVLAAQGVDESSVVTALNKADLLDDAARDARLAAVEDDAPTPVPVSVTVGTGLGRLRAAVAERLPTDRVTLSLPTGDDAMGVVSRAYDRVAVESVEYGPETVTLTVRGRPAAVSKLEAEAAAIDDK